MAMSLKQELATYRRELPGFLKEHEGEYVLIKENQVAGFWKTFEEALEAGHDRFALEPFMVRQVQREEPRVAILGHPVFPCRRSAKP